MHNANDEDDIFEEDTEKWMEKKRAERIRELKAELAEARTALRIAAGYISATPAFSHLHPEKVLDWLMDTTRKYSKEEGDE